MDLSNKIHPIELRSTLLTATGLFDLRKPACFRPTNSFPKKIKFHPIRVSAVATETGVDQKDDIESLFSSESEVDYQRRGNKFKQSSSSGISSGVRLENISKSYKGVTVLKNVSWEVKKGEKVGLVGVNGAGKTTQLRIISGMEEPDSGNVVKAKPNMKISFLSQEFEVSMSRTVREEFLSSGFPNRFGNRFNKQTK